MADEGSDERAMPRRIGGASRLACWVPARPVLNSTRVQPASASPCRASVAFTSAKQPTPKYGTASRLRFGERGQVLQSEGAHYPVPLRQPGIAGSHVRRVVPIVSALREWAGALVAE